MEIAKQGGIDAIIKAMGNHPDHAGLQAQGCGALWSLAANNDANQVEIAKQGGIDAINKAMGNHPDHAEVQRLGSMLLERFRQVGSMALERFDIQITAAGAA